MQSTETKAKRKQKSTKEPVASQVQGPISTQEETPKLKRRTTAKKVTAEPTSAAKQHRTAVRRLTAPEAVTAPVPATPTIATPVTREQIAVLAYSYWENRGYQGGSPEADWLRAERELRPR
jgi:hypothetical protein